MRRGGKGSRFLRIHDDAGSFRAAAEALRKVSIDLTPIQESDKSSRISLNDQTDPVAADPYSKVAAFGPESLEIGNPGKGLSRFSTFDDISNLPEKRPILDSFQVPGKTGFE